MKPAQSGVEDKPMNRISVAGLPAFVTIFATLLGLYCAVVGIVGLFDPTGVPEFVSGADNLGSAWAGRMAGTGVALLLAVVLRAAAAYAVAFGAAIFREIGDAIVAASDTSDGLPLVVVLVVLAIDIAAFVLALRATRAGVAPTPSS